MSNCGYTEKNIITVKDGKEKFGFLKIIPNSKPKINEEVLNNLSGVIQILDSEMNIRSQTEFLIGIPQSINSSAPNSNYGRVYCRETFDVVAHYVREQGMFSPVTANPETANDSSVYYTIVSTGQSCFGTSGEEDLYISAPDSPTIGSSGGGRATTVSKLFGDPKFLHTNFLLSANKMDLLNLVANYIFVHDPDSSGYYNEINESVINQINDKLAIFENNNLFYNFDNLQDLLSNKRFYIQGEGYHYDNRIYNLINYLFDDPTQENADFVAWAMQFFIDNTSQNGICTVSWDEFQNWLAYSKDFIANFKEDKEILNYFLHINVNSDFNVLERGYKDRMSQQELQLYNNLSLIDKFFYLLSANTAENKAQQKYPTSLYNGKGDAYRHTMWNAYATRYIGADITQQLTTAHENRPPDPSNPYEYKENEMDLQNNYMGRGIGVSNSLEIEHYVDLWLINGNLFYLSNLEQGLPSGRPTRFSQLIPTNQ